MDTEFKFGRKVRLKSFHNSFEPPEETVDEENFWKLIGSKGVIVGEKKKVHPAFPSFGEQVLVEFEADITKMGLICHNQNATNALWIFLLDLELVE